MVGLILGAVIALGFSFMCLWAYRKGLKDGLEVNQGKDIAPIKTPLKVAQDFQQAKEEKEEYNKVLQGYNNLLNYDGTPQKEVSNGRI